MKIRKSSLCFLLSGILTAVFCVKNPLDYRVYSNTLNSAPFWVTVLVNAICFLLPALILLILGWLSHRKGK